MYRRARGWIALGLGTTALITLPASSGAVENSAPATAVSEAQPAGTRVLTNREAAIFSDLSYKSEDFIRQLLDPTQPLPGEGENPNPWPEVRQELAGHWVLARSWHNNDGFDAFLFTSTDSEPMTVLSIEGTHDWKDWIADGNIATKTWPEQANSARLVADELARDNFPHLWVTGHSLGGYLAQIVAVRSSAASLPADLNRWDTTKVTNPNLDGVITFNAPYVQGAWYAPLAQEYEKAYAVLEAEHKDSYRNYATDNDPVTRGGSVHSGYRIIPGNQYGHYIESFVVNDAFTDSV